MSGRQPTQASRDALLILLKALTCDAGSADSFADFVQRRADILEALDEISEPWTQPQKALLQEALVTGAHILAEAQGYRQQLARRIDHLRSAKRSHQGYGATAPARIRKLF